MGTDNQPLPESLAGHATWQQQDWDWDSRQMVAGPKHQQGGDAAAEPAACRAVPRQSEHSALPVPGSIDKLAPGGTSGARSPSETSGGGAEPKRAPRGRPSTMKTGVCQADACGVDLSGLTYYHVRNK